MLPDGFEWRHRCHLSKVDDGLFLDGTPVAYLLAKVDGSWFATLDIQRPYEQRPKSRDCSNLENGRRGCELWACRHEKRLRLEIAEKIASRPSNHWKGMG